MSAVDALASRSIEQHKDRFLAELAAGRGASQHTLRAYRGDLREFVAYLDHRGIAEVAAVSQRVLRG
jgi:site-specific recombinase XerD